MRAEPFRPMPEAAAALWTRYRTAPDAETRAQLLDLYIGLVHHGAREVVKRGARELELDELISAGTLGLVQAIEGFDPDRGLAFSTYAMPRIRGAMLDELRSRDWMPRSVRTRRRVIGRALAELMQRHGRPPDAAEVAETLGITLSTYWRWLGEADPRVMLALHHSPDTDSGDRPSLEETIPDLQSHEPGESITHQETLDELREGFAALPEKERTVLSLYYFEELSLRQIGELLHVSESRISQIRTRALRRLRDHVGLEGEAA